MSGRPRIFAMLSVLHNSRKEKAEPLLLWKCENLEMSHKFCCRRVETPIKFIILNFVSFQIQLFCVKNYFYGYITKVSTNLDGLDIILSSKFFHSNLVLLAPKKIFYFPI